MSLTKDAIQQITETALSAAGKMLPTNTPVALIPDAVSVADLERYMAGRSRFRGTFSTHSLADFVGHVIKRNMPGAKGFIDQDEMSCSLFFNIGDEISPGHADDRALLKLKPSAGYKAAQLVNSKAMTQKDMSDWIEDWHQYLTPVDENETAIAIAKAIAAVRTITVKATSESETTVGDTSASRSAMDQIEARSKETLPVALLFNVIPFEGLTEQQIKFRLSVITSGQQPVLKLRWIGEEVQREDIAQEFKAVLEDKIGEAASLALGSFDPR